MPVCEYTYCGAVYDGTPQACPVCGFPRDRGLLGEPEALFDTTPVGGQGLLPTRLLDMHQILPALDGVVEAQLAAMDRFGVVKALLQSAPTEAGSLLGNDALRNLKGDRFWSSWFVDPRSAGALEALNDASAAGIRVIKLLPPIGFAPDDPDLDSFWHTLQHLRLVAMVHTGFITARHKREEAHAGAFLSSRYGDPLHLDRVARKFPEMTIILCHLGGAVWYEAAARMVTQHSNVWGDISGSGLFALKRLLRLGAALDWSKVFWGNDSPPFAYPFNLRLCLGALRAEGAETLAPGLFHDNGSRFAEQFLPG